MTSQNIEEIRQWIFTNSVPKDYVVEFEVKYQPKFQKGDRVRFIKDYHKTHNLYYADKGDLATVLRDDDEYLQLDIDGLGAEIVIEGKHGDEIHVLYADPSYLERVD